MSMRVLAWPKERNKNENPYNALLYGNMSEAVKAEEFNYRNFSVKEADILHVHWPDRLLDDRKRWRLKWRFSRFIKAIDRLHRAGGKLVWTVHNLQSREIQHQDLAEAYLQKFIHRVDGFVFLTELSQKLFYDKYGIADKQSHVVIPHMHYRDVYQQVQADAARSHWLIGADDFVLGFFGKIRANKGIESLIDCLSEINPCQPHLFIAGNPGKRSLSEKLQNHLKIEKKATALLRHIENNEVGLIVSACDAMIFPYVDILNSGSALLALSLGCPVIAPNVGSFPEIQKMVGKEWLYLYQQPLEKDKLRDAIQWVQNRSTLLEKPDLSAMEPASVSEQTEFFYQKVLS